MNERGKNEKASSWKDAKKKNWFFSLFSAIHVMKIKKFSGGKFNLQSFLEKDACKLCVRVWIKNTEKVCPKANIVCVGDKADLQPTQAKSRWPSFL
jgi:hypothetical protein